MKYIRTENGIYELANERTITEFQVIDHLHNRAFLKDEILAQANTIEELCDEFVVKYNSFNPIIHDTLEEIEYLDEKVKIKGYTIYGAVWTERGLIYVAKMDSEGKLCLI